MGIRSVGDASASPVQPEMTIQRREQRPNVERRYKDVPNETRLDRPRDTQKKYRLGY